jgi:hypothetical protein
VFTCTVSKGRLLSLCGPTDLSAMQYRFGRPGAIELRHPDVPEGSLQAFTFARYTRPLTTMMGLRFTRGGYTYEVFDDLVESQASAGVTVTMPDGGQSQLVCEGAVTSRLMELEDRVPTTDLWR